MKYDDASWHHDAAHSDNACYTHIGFYFAWAVERGLVVDSLFDETEASRERLRARSLAPGEYARWIDLDKLTHHEFSDEGNAFSKHYYNQSGYLSDYENLFLSPAQPEKRRTRQGKGWEYSRAPERRRGFRKPVRYASFYEVADSWKNHDRISEKIDQRFQEWRSVKSGKTAR